LIALTADTADIKILSDIFNLKNNDSEIKLIQNMPDSESIRGTANINILH